MLKARNILSSGARETLRRFHPKLVMEVIPSQLANMNTTVEELRALIRTGLWSGQATGDYGLGMDG
jgi:hypothetical protein